MRLRALLYRLNQHLLRLRARDSWLLGIILVLLIGSAQYGAITLLGWQNVEEDRAQIARQERLTAEFEAQLLSLQQDQDDPRQDQLQRQIEQLGVDITRTNETITTITANLVTPEEMVRVLRQLLERQDGLRLRRLETLPMTSTGSSGDEGTQVYRHALTMELDGSFNAIARYIRAVEDSEWQIYWQSMHYEIGQYPNGRLTITLYTLSNEEGWLNV
ncbi:MAG: hypothetical protein LAT62_02585 [Natronospirillum sp.]|uniref:hypothetical protein n=1 Tax=Natronospirillum sp. TaxID=2812955 RepID=UPI0025F390EF|nr:hypothetical protein [Natronospirillum sp.]MCH8550795.1 hypothetical protein [Natronospirillum sp.]